MLGSERPPQRYLRRLLQVAVDARRSGPRPPWLAAFARIPVLVSAGLLVFDAAVYPALPAELLHHSSGQCWSAWISALLFPAMAVALALLGSLALRYLEPDVGRLVSLVPDFFAWTFLFIAAAGLVPAVEGFRCA